MDRLGPLIYLVQVNSAVFWQRHIDHLRPTDDTVNVQDSTTPLMPYLSVQSDFVTLDFENSETLPVLHPAVEQSLPCGTE